MEPEEIEVDALLRRSMTAPAPALAPDFEKRVLRAARRDSELLGRYRWMFLAGYGTVSAVTSLVAMRSAGLSWLPIVEILVPLALVVAGYAARRTQHTTA